MNISQTLVNYVFNMKYEKIPAEAIQIQKKALIDGLAVMLAATTLGEGCSHFIEFAIEEGGDKKCTVLGTSEKCSPIMAALANGSLSHAIDFEDAHDLALIHSNAVSIPASLAVAEAVGCVSGQEFLTALTLGSDVACRIALGLNEDLLKYGWYMPPIHESMGAVMAVGKLLNLDECKLMDALTLNMNQVTCSGELLNSPQSVMRSVRDGFAAKSAVLAGLLAKKGVVARYDAPLEGKLGYYHSYARDNYKPERITADLGICFESAQISFKPWPGCRGTHPCIEATISLMKENNITVKDIERIHLVVSPVNEMLLLPKEIKYTPDTSISAKFSLPFAVSTAANFGTVTLDHYAADAIKNEVVLAFAQNITFDIDTSLSKSETATSVVTIYTNTKTYSKKILIARGSKQNPMSDEDFNNKFLSCARYSAKKYTDVQLKAILDTLYNLEKVNDIRELTALL